MKQPFNRITAITNILPDNQYVFMCEFDNTTLEFVIKQTKFISELFNIDIDILSSSPKSYHLVSYDIIDKQTLLKATNWLDFPDNADWLPIDEIDLYNVSAYTLKLTQRHLPIGCALRLSEKYLKESPFFITRIGHKKSYFFKSYEHLRFYKLYCKVPDFKKSVCFLKLPVQIVMYNVGTGSKSRKGRRTSLEQKVYNKLQCINTRVQK